MRRPQEFRGRGGLNINYARDSFAYLMPRGESIRLDLVTTRQLMFWLSRYIEFREKLHGTTRSKKNDLPSDNSTLDT